MFCFMRQVFEVQSPLFVAIIIRIYHPWKLHWYTFSSRLMLLLFSRESLTELFSQASFTGFLATPGLASCLKRLLNLRESIIGLASYAKHGSGWSASFTVVGKGFWDCTEPSKFLSLSSISLFKKASNVLSIWKPVFYKTRDRMILRFRDKVGYAGWEMARCGAVSILRAMFTLEFCSSFDDSFWQRPIRHFCQWADMLAIQRRRAQRC